MRSLALALSVAAACHSSTERPGNTAPPDPRAAADDSHKSELHALSVYEEQKRARTDFAALPPGDEVLGPDPYAIARLPGTDRFVATLEGEGAVVVLDASLAEVQRLPAPARPSDIAFGIDGEVFVAGKGDNLISRYRQQPDGTLVAAGRVRARRAPVPGSIDAGDGFLYAVDEYSGRLLALELARTDDAIRVSGQYDIEHCKVPVRVWRAGAALVINCLYDHTLLVRGLEDGVPRSDGEVRIQHDGPFWTYAAVETADGLLIAAGGVEDHALDRTGKAFGRIDSFLWVYRVTPDGQVARLAELNLGEHDVITPKWVDLQPTETGATIAVAGYGGQHMAVVDYASGFDAAPVVTPIAAPPGMRALVAVDDGWVGTNPLLDAFVRIPRSRAYEVIELGDRAARAPDAWLGEIMVYTTLMSPENTTEGRFSRFSCEACHFEGYSDGRTHHSGRGDVYVTTRVLKGLFNVRPYFSRALDRTTTRMIRNKFRVVNRGEGNDPWFDVRVADYPWLAHVPGLPATISGLHQRRAVMDFLAAYTHSENPMSRGRDTFGPREKAGAEVFDDLCERCHAARLMSDDPETDVPFEQWESLIMTGGAPIVWTRGEYRKVGITPMPHEDGARMPSLRRLYRKRPYFTNGSAKSIREVLDNIRVTDGGLYHGEAPDHAVPLTAAQKTGLAAFLRLL